jgi:hypothetical protein
MMTINVATQYSKTPGPRTRDEGPASGQAFFEDLLLPAFKEARANKTKLLVDLDGTDGYSTAFLEAAFVDLARLTDSYRQRGSLHDALR